MDADAVREYVEQSRSVLEASPGMDEQNTKVKLVQPFIELLGWDLYSSEVELEYPIQMGSRRTKVDYALLIGETPVVFVEAKGTDSRISEGEIGQLKSYMRQELEVDWGIITNGESFEILTKGNSYGTQEEISLGEFDLEELESNPDVLEILSKDSIQSGKSDEIADQIARSREAIDHLQREQDEVARALADTLESEIGDDVPIDLESRTRGFIDDLIDALEEQRSVIGEEPSEAIRFEPDGTEDAGEPSVSEGRDPDAGDRYTVKFTDSNGTIATFNGGLQSEAMVDAVDYLIGNHGLIDELESIPWVPGRNKAIINDDPEWEESRTSYKELIDDYYLDTHLNKEGKKRELRRMAEKCGLDVIFEGDW